MVDLETLATTPDACILSIGAVAFDPMSFEISSKFYRVINFESCRALGLRIEKDTLDWWMNQSKAAKNVLVESRNPKTPKIDEVIVEFDSWFKKNKGKELWSNGASFDIPILNFIYHKLGARAPWKFWDERCVRTLLKIFGEDKSSREGTYHSALADAIYQTRQIQNFYAEIFGEEEEPPF